MKFLRLAVLVAAVASAAACNATGITDSRIRTPGTIHADSVISDPNMGSPG